MNINNAAGIQRPNIQLQKSEAKPNGGSNASSSVAPKTDANSVGSSSILERLKVSSGETRDKLINEIKTSVQNGDFSTRQAAEDTANAILDL